MQRPALKKNARAALRDLALQQRQKTAAVQDTLGTALRESAAFLAGEIADGTVAAQAAGVTGAVLQEASVCGKNLASWSSGPVAAVKYATVRQQLLAAERAVERLHTATREARKAQAEERVVQRLLRCLCFALGKETLEPGRREGGVIAFEASPADWGWIARRLHRRHLATATRVTVNDRPVSLGLDRALGLYVTQSSHSSDRYAFDISVHLWQRREGQTGAPAGPSPTNEPFPPFNEEAWFDTFVTCAVLHLPRKG